MKKDNLVYIDDVLDAIKKIKKYTRGVTKSEFMKNGLVIDAVIRNLEIIGEASSKLSPSFTHEHEDIEWRKIIGMRNRIIHSYDTVDPEIVWDVIKHELSELEGKLKKVVE
jgi:uncharacterized protein with HEPN domain